MATPQATAEHYAQQRRLAAAAVLGARAAWRGMTPEFDAAWPRVLRRLMVLLAAAQLSAARSADEYLPAVLNELGLDAPAAARLAPQALVGAASDGRRLDSLLYGAVTASKDAVAAGREPVEALATGGRWLDMAAMTQVADTARLATSVGITARPRLTGWVRMVNTPCCSRCAVLAGRLYRWSQGFQRHPRCQCRHIPATEDVAGDLTTDPDELYRRGRITDLSEVEKQALDEGADLAQVVNARRGSKGMTTTEGTTRRGRFRQVSGRRVRLTPEGIYREAADRDDALRLLHLHGYLI